mgnify:CR=1 FL=1
MKTLLLAASIFGAVNMAPPFASIDTGCTYVTVTGDDRVIIDWPCVTRTADRYKVLRRQGATPEHPDAFAFVLESPRNGTAIVK